ncbi:MAG: hypothetical protein AAGC99_22195 [Pseudomonadota bacterium]
MTVKERQPNEPCFLLVEPYEEIGVDEKLNIIFDMPPGTDYDDAKRLADQLNETDANIRVVRF